MKTYLLIFSLLTSIAMAGTVSKEGGISGGGGDLLPSEQVGSDALDEMLGTSRMRLLLYFNYLDLHPEDLPPAYLNLFDKDEDLITQVREQITFGVNNEPCLDKDGHEVDGSIYPKNQTGVCISTFNLGKKLRKDNAQIQLIALLAHEYAHLAGADEAQAQEVQKDVLAELAGSSNSGAKNFLNSYIRLNSEALWGISPVTDAIESSDISGLCQKTRELSFKVDDLLKTTQDNFSIVDFEDQKFINTVVLFAKHVTAGSCLTFDPTSDPDTSYRNYIKAFGNGSVTTISKLNSYIIPNFMEKEIEGSYEIQKITDIKVLDSEVTRLRNYLRQIENRIWSKLSRIEYND